MLWKPRNETMDWLRAGFSERQGGVSEAYGPGELNLGWTETDEPRHVVENRRRWVRTVWDGGAGDGEPLDASAETLPELVTLAQVHSADSLVVRTGDPPRVNSAGRTTLRGDGIMTAEAEMLLGVQTADCVPVLVADRRRRAVAGFHAGWRGTAARIVEHGIAQMEREFGSRPEDLWAAVGPAIEVCCYSVGEEVRERFLQGFDYGQELLRGKAEDLRAPAGRVDEQARSGRLREPRSMQEQQSAPWFLDLRLANQRQLEAAGIPRGQIQSVGGCTACSRTAQGTRQFFSHRAEHGRTGRMMAAIGIRPTNC